jgi:hypothetical protein
MTEKLIAYHGEPLVKAKYQARFAAHRAADQVIQGTGFENGRGCFVGCTLDDYDHTRFPVELGWPEWLAHLADKIFEGIPREEAAQFGTDLLAAVPTGADLEPVRWRLAIARHERQIAALANNQEAYAEQVRDAIQGVIDYCKAQLAGTWAKTPRSVAEAAAWSAAKSAAEAARSAAKSAAWSAAWSAESVAWSAAWSAAESVEESVAWSAARSAAESEAWQWERDTLLALVRNTGSSNHD